MIWPLHHTGEINLCLEQTISKCWWCSYDWMFPNIFPFIENYERTLNTKRLKVAPVLTLHFRGNNIGFCCIVGFYYIYKCEFYWWRPTHNPNPIFFIAAIWYVNPYAIIVLVVIHLGNSNFLTDQDKDHWPMEGCFLQCSLKQCGFQSPVVKFISD